MLPPEICLPISVQSTMTPQVNTEGKTVQVCQFKLTDIPDVMKNLNWRQAERFMRRWFSAPPYEIPIEYKKGTKSASELSASHVLSDLPFDWLRTASSRVEPKIDALVQQLTIVNEQDGFAPS